MAVDINAIVSTGNNEAAPVTQSFNGLPYYINALLNQNPVHYWNYGSFGTAVNVTYNFPNWYYTAEGPAYSFTASEQNYGRQAIALWADVANVNFVEVSAAGTADIEIRKVYQSPGVAGGTFYPHTTISGTEYGGSIYLDPSYSPAAPGTYNFLTIVHELGHALGLKHPGNYNAGGGGTEGPYLPSGEDNHSYTVMSYYDKSGLSGVNDLTPMLYDIAAIQYVYGARQSHTGDDTYTFATTTQLKTIWDAGGNDTFDASNQTTTCDINLNPGAFSSIGTGGAELNNIAIAFNCYIENANGGTNADVIIGSPVNNALSGGDGNDSLYGNNGDDALYGGNGNDTLVGGEGGDTMVGGDGNDIYYVDNPLDVVRDAVGAGYDIIHVTSTTTGFALASGQQIEELRLDGLGAINAAGNEFNDFIVGNIFNNTLNGNGGDDALFGNAGDDTLNGGTGGDTMAGGTGGDTYVVDNAGDLVIENANEGTDWVMASISYTLPANVENLTLTGAGTFSGTGNAGDNKLYGNIYNNVLDGLGGIDTMSGGAGDDAYFVDNGNDVCVESAGNGGDTVVSTVSYMLTAGSALEALVLLDVGGAIAGAGNEFNNLIQGNSSANVLSGGRGDDALYGRGGADTFVFGDGCGGDTIGDFSHAQGDQIDLRQISNLADFNQLTMADHGSYTTVSWGTADSVSLIGIHPNELVANDFLIN
ncbi:MAG: M10 family metallopeptidase C-terminal domain-containing protein [Proteobacteria bacterium]|nr:M10 family metallopeptidase C-terminal domain-containing protein [Pseudomonadota bacterium]